MARISKVIVELKHIGFALEEFKAATGKYPDTNRGLTSLAPEYTLKVPIDPWGRTYNYEKQKSHYHVWTLGRDGVVEGQGEDFDFSSDTPTENEEQRNLEAKKNAGIVDWYVVLPVLVVFLLLLLTYCALKLLFLSLRKSR
ncbi:MAG: type II secretion system protein GspG [Pseudomonadota bacterium]